MFDLHKELTTFYHHHVRLKEERTQLAKRRDLNLRRLNEGLDKLGEAKGVTYAHPVRHRDQGGYAMHTLNKHRDNTYDLDCAIIFRKDDLPSSALEARKRIVAAFKQTGVKFARDPEVRTNAVTVWYAEGYHIDFAVYRESATWWGTTIIEHAGRDWQEADPAQMTAWFNDRVSRLSPSGRSVTVATGQMRRIVRWLKMFTKSRFSWNLPGGMIISALVAECYRWDTQRDDIALRDTMRAICDRLQHNQHVRNPIFTDQYLTSRPEYERQVVRLQEQLAAALIELAVLCEAECTRKQALGAWYAVFRHPYWQHVIEAEENAKASRLSVGTLINTPTTIDTTDMFG